MIFYLLMQEHQDDPSSPLGIFDSVEAAKNYAPMIGGKPAEWFLDSHDPDVWSSNSVNFVSYSIRPVVSFIETKPALRIRLRAVDEEAAVNNFLRSGWKLYAALPTPYAISNDGLDRRVIYIVTRVLEDDE